MFFRIIQNKKVRIIVLSLFLIAVSFLVWRDYRERDKVEQAFNSFVKNKDFTSVEFDLHVNDRSLENQVMDPRTMEELWTIIKDAKPGSGPRRVYDILFIIHFNQTDGTTVTVDLRKDVDSEQVSIAFYLPGKAGYSLNGKDPNNVINRLVMDYVSL